MMLCERALDRHRVVHAYLAEVVGQAHSRAGCALNELLGGRHQLSVWELWLMCSCFLLLGCALCVVGLSGAGVALSHVPSCCVPMYVLPYPWHCCFSGA